MNVRWIALLLLIATMNCAGCMGIRPAALAELLAAGPNPEKEESHRRRFQEDRSPAEMRWLLANCVTVGMSPSEVGRILGEEGQRVRDDGWVKNDGGSFQAGDETWKWASDREGHSLLLVFRENRLVSFDPEEFRD